MSSDFRDNNKQGLERRDFIKLGATGVVAGLAGCAAPMALDQTAGAETAVAGFSSESAALALENPPIPEASDLVDPEMVPVENWQEPWTWRPEEWPDAALDLNLVGNQNPGPSSSPGNPNATLFSFNGISPGPTIRVRSDGELKIKLRNTLGLNEQETMVSPAPDPFDFTPDVEMKICSLVEEQVLGGNPQEPRPCLPFIFPEQVLQVISPEVRPGWSLKVCDVSPYGANQLL